MAENFYKIAIVGSKEVTQGFEAFGFEVVQATGVKEATEKLFELKRKMQVVGGEERNVYAIVFVMEEIMQKINREDYTKLTAHALPAIIALPGPEGSTGFGVKRLSQLVERAVGQNILGD